MCPSPSPHPRHIRHPSALHCQNAVSQQGTSAPREAALLSPWGPQAAIELHPDSLWTVLRSIPGPFQLTSGAGMGGNLSASITDPFHSPPPYHDLPKRGPNLVLSSQWPHQPTPGQWRNDHQRPWGLTHPGLPPAGCLWDLEACPYTSLDLSFFICIMWGWIYD